MKPHPVLLPALALLLSASLGAQSPLRNGSDHAILFYVTDYKDGWERLPDTKTETEAIAKELREQYGFSTELVPNPSKQQIEDWLNKANAMPLGEKDQLLLFFSMHGHYDPDANRGYLVPADGKTLRQDPAAWKSWLSYDELSTYLSRNKCGHLLLALDACYSGAFGTRWKSAPGDLPWEARASGNSAADCRQRISSALAFASRHYFTSGSETQRTPARSLFASRWLEALRKGREAGLLRIHDLRYFLESIEYPKPEGGTFSGKHREGGDFVFVHKNACGSAPAQQPKATDADPDGDQVTAAQDECPDEFGSPTAKGCPDFDEDGIPNKQDECPFEPGTPERKGCPGPADSDGDGVPDASDKCRSTKGLPKYEGCPDSDADLVPDHLDHCPSEAGKPDNNGCPTDDLPNFVRVDGGTFQMGSNDGDSGEKPVHAVTLSDFYLGRYEVTVEEFGQFVKATSYQTDADKDGGSYFWNSTKNEWEKKAGTNWKYDVEGNMRPASEYTHPVIHVSWNDAIAYCNWRSEKEGLTKVYTISSDKVSANWSANGYRLPTEAEWEYAAGNGSRHTKYSWGNAQPSGKQGGNVADETSAKKFNWARNNTNIFMDYDDGYAATAPVGKFNPNDFGLYDMSGNVWEWCWDWKAEYPSTAQTNPHGPDTGSLRVLRGGSWDDSPAFLRCTYRNNDSPGLRHNGYGFRLARAAR